MPDEIREALQRLNAMSDAELADLQDQILAGGEALAEEDSDEAAEQLEALAEASEQVVQARATLAARAQRRAEALDKIKSGRPEEPQPETTEVVAEDEEVQPEPETGGQPSGEPAAEPATVAAGADPEPEPTAPSPGAVGAQAPRVEPQLKQSGPRITVTAGATDIMPGTQVSWGDIPRLISDRLVSVSGSRTPSNRKQAKAPGFEEKITVVKIHRDDLGGRQLGQDVGDNLSLLHSLQASGGLCAPLEAYYEQAFVSSAKRPLRSGLAQFGADRMGIRWAPPHTLADIDTAVGVWTVDDDEDPYAEKTCQHLVCLDEQSQTADAIYNCLEFGNMNARAFPEQISNDTQLALVAHARLAEQTLLTKIDAASTNQDAPGAVQLGSTRDFLGLVARLVYGMRTRHRMDDDAPVEIIAPSWFPLMTYADLLREAPGAAVDRFMTDMAFIERSLGVINVSVLWTMDQDIAAALVADDPLAGWPDTMRIRAYPPGTHLFLDSGTLDLGIVRDSTLNSTNDYRIFSETFEGHAMVGVESIRIDVPVCPNGQAAALIDVAGCDF